MHIVLWDTRSNDVSKDFAGGMGIGQFPGGKSLRAKIVRRFYVRDRRPTALLFGHLAAVFSKLGHTVEYAEERIPRQADLYVFNPVLISLKQEINVMRRVKEANPAARIWVVGTVASVMPEAFEELDVTVIRGEAEQVLWTMDRILQNESATVQLGAMEDLDAIPFPDWTPFRPKSFRIGYDFTRFPTALIQQSRGCTMKCNYCPYILLENQTRFRSPEAVADEIRHDMDRWGFRSFKFRDPLFGADKKRLFRLIEQLARLPRRIQFSIESRIELLPPEVLRALRSVGLTSITVGIETPDAQMQRKYGRAPIREDRQHEFIARCRELGIRTVAGFMIGFPEDTEESVHRVLRYAKHVGPTYANFNVVTPYPGTEFFEQIRDKIADFDFSRYTVYTPLLKYDHLTAERMSELLEKCFRQYYFRWDYFRENGALLWPALRWLGLGTIRPKTTPGADAAHPGPPGPKTPLETLVGDRHLRADGPHGRPGLSSNAKQQGLEE